MEKESFSVLKISSLRQSDSEVTTGGSKDNKNDARLISRRNSMASIYGRDAANSISHLSDCLENLSIEAGSDFSFVIEFIRYYSIKLIWSMIDISLRTFRSEHKRCWAWVKSAEHVNAIRYSYLFDRILFCWWQSCLIQIWIYSLTRSVPGRAYTYKNIAR